MINQVCCLNPQIIVNPKCFHYLALYRTYIRHNQLYNVPDSLLSALLSNHTIKPLRVNHDDYVIDVSTGEQIPFYIAVPCRKCEACAYKLVASYSQRANFEALSSKIPVLFVTLTYNDKYIGDNLLTPVDVQLFKKRFNKLSSQLFSGTKLKYMVFGEYGSQHGRKHYHLFIFGFPFFHLSSDINYQDFLTTQLLQFCWRDTKKGFGGMSLTEYRSKNYPVYRQHGEDDKSLGFVTLKILRDGNLPTQYVTKYITKSLTHHDDRPYFRSCSINLGLQYALEHRKFALSSPDGCFHTSYSSHCVGFCRFYLDKLFPTYSSSVSVDIRNLLNDYFSFLRLNSSRSLGSYHDYILSTFKDVIANMHFEPTFKSSYSFDDVTTLLLTSSVPDVKQAIDIDYERQCILAKMMKGKDIDVQAYCDTKRQYYLKHYETDNQ